MFQKRKICLAVTTAVLLPTPVLVNAQEGALEEVIVTASRRAESVQDIPFNVSALSQDDLIEAGITRPEDLAKRIAGVSVIDGGARFRNSLSIRGIGAPGASSSDFFTTEATSYYVGETPMENLNLRIKDVERMEVLRGPQGTLYGGGAMGGTVRYILNRPDPDAFGAKVATNLYDIDGADSVSSDTEFMLNIPIGDNFALRAVGNYLDQKGFIDYVTFPDKVASGALPEISEDNYNTEETWMGRIAARWLINDSWDAELAYIAQDQESYGRQAFSGPSTDVFGEPIESDFVDEDTHTGFNDESSQRDIKLVSFDLRGSLDFADLTFHASHYEDDYDTEGDVTRFLEGLYVGFYPEFDDFNAWNENEITTETDTVELRLQSTGENFDWVVGTFYTQQDREWNLLEYTPGLNEFFWGEGTSVPPNDFNLESEGDYSQLAFYAEGTWHATDNLDVTLGIRHFDMEDEIDMFIWYPIYEGLDDFDDRSDPCLTDPDSICFSDSSKGDFDDQFYKLNLSYTFSDDVLTYFTYSEGFRRGGANAASGGQASDSEAVEKLFEEARFYQPDSLNNYEIGVKSTLMDGRMTLNGAVYYIEWEDMQIIVGSVDDDQGNSISLPIDQRVNAGDAESIGAEVELSAMLGETLRLDASASYNKIEADGDNAYFEDGEAIYGKPEWQASLALNGDYQLNNGLQWGWYAAVAYRDDVATGNEFLSELSSYTLLDAALSLYGSNWTASLYGDNLTDEDYETSVSSAEFRNRIYTGRPRTLGIRLSYDF